MSKEVEPRQMMCSKEAAWLLGVSKPTLNNMVKKGQISVQRLSSRVIRYYPDQIEALVKPPTKS